MTMKNIPSPVKTTIWIGLIIIMLTPNPAFSKSNKQVGRSHSHRSNRKLMKNELRRKQFSVNDKFRSCFTLCRCFPVTKTIDCSYANLIRIPPRVYSSTKKLLLTKNLIDKLPVEGFKDLKNLNELRLDWNRITVISENSFLHYKRLKSINLAHNRITFIAGNSFINLTLIEEIDLRGNLLSTIQPNTFLLLHHLKEIDLSGNEITRIPYEELDSLPELRYLYMDRNKWICDCNLQAFQRQLHSRGIDTGVILCKLTGKEKKTMLRHTSTSILCGYHVITSLILILCITLPLIIFLLYGKCAGWILYNEIGINNKEEETG